MSNLSYFHLGEKIDETKNIIMTFRSEGFLPKEAGKEIVTKSVKNE